MRPVTGTSSQAYWLAEATERETLSSEAREAVVARRDVSVQQRMPTYAPTLSSPRTTNIVYWTAETSPSAMATDDLFDARLEESFESLARDIVQQATDFEVDVLDQALDSVSEDVAIEAFHKLNRELEHAEWKPEHAPPSLRQMFEEHRTAYNQKRITPPFASLVRLGRSRHQYLLSHNPSDSQTKYLASLWKHNVTVAVALAASSVWPTLGNTRQVGPFRVTSVGQVAQTIDGLSLPIVVRRVRLQYQSQEKYLTVFCVAWPDCQPLPKETLAHLSRSFRQASHGGIIAIHCRMGIGRSGTMALANALADEQRPLTVMDAFRLFLQLRLQRKGCIETAQQFVAALQSAAV